jgi:hypothetical protein
MKKRYRALRIISGIYRFLGGLLLILAIAAAVITIVTAPEATRFSTPVLISAGTALGGGLFSALTLLAFGELFSLLIALEENTRASSMLLQKLYKLNEPMQY